MKVVITCGHEHSGDALVHGLLQRAGLAEAAPSRREAMSVHDLQARMLAALGIDAAAGTAAPAAPGRLWDELAVDLFLGNMDTPAWGWHGPAALPLLEFWHEFDPQARFVLVYAPPEFAVGQALQGREATPELIAAALGAWTRANHRLLQFYHRHAERAELVNVLTALHAPAPLLERLDQRWDLRLPTAAEHAAAGPRAVSAIPGILARGAVRDHDTARALFAELESMSALDAGAAPALEELAAWNEFARLQREHAVAKADAGQLRSQLDALEHTVAELGGQARQLPGATEEIARLTRERDALRAELQESRAALNEVRRQRDDSARLAAEQLDRTSELQAELEATAATAARQLAQLNELQKTTASRAHFADPAPLRAREQQLQQENELLLAQLHQVQEELEQHFLKSQQLGKRTDELTQALQAEKQATGAQQLQLVEERESLRKLSAERQAQIDSLKKQLAAQPRTVVDPTLEARQKELTQENELLLLQLHQVQEELEHYFLQSQELARRSGAQAASEAYARQFWRGNQPAEVVVDLRGEIDGGNWYEPEIDGRWAGPGKVSTLRIPALTPGDYVLALHVMDAMTPEILQGMEVLLNGTAIDLAAPQDPAVPLVLQGQFSSGPARDEHWQIELRFPALVSPAERGLPDERVLAIRLKALELILTAPLDA